jgi:hypothetical protein
MHRRRFAALLAVASVLVALTPAHAEPQPTVALAAPPTPVWYGWRVMAVDLAAVGAFIAADKTSSVPLAGGSILAYGIVSPVMHAPHSVPRMLGSLALRIGLPLLGAAATFHPSCGGNHSDPGDGTCNDGGNGAMVGAAAAMILDDLFAFDDVAPAPAPSSVPRPATSVSSLTPTITINHGVSGLGLAGTF